MQSSWTILGDAGKDENYRKLVVVECECGTVRVVRVDTLKSGQSRSCGHNLNVTHGHTRKGNLSPTYISWRNMMARCYYSGSIRWDRYGGRGISVCPRWHQFENFLADMGERPEGTSIGRLDHDENYCPANCAWEAS